MFLLCGIAICLVIGFACIGVLWNFIIEPYFPTKEKVVVVKEVVEVKDPLYELYPEVRHIVNDDEYANIARKIMGK